MENNDQPQFIQKGVGRIKEITLNNEELIGQQRN